MVVEGGAAVKKKVNIVYETNFICEKPPDTPLISFR